MTVQVTRSFTDNTSVEIGRTTSVQSQTRREGSLRLGAALSAATVSAAARTRATFRSMQNDGTISQAASGEVFQLRRRASSHAALPSQLLIGRGGWRSRQQRRVRASMESRSACLSGRVPRRTSSQPSDACRCQRRCRVFSDVLHTLSAAPCPDARAHGRPPENSRRRHAEEASSASRVVSHLHNDDTPNVGSPALVDEHRVPLAPTESSNRALRTDVGPLEASALGVLVPARQDNEISAFTTRLSFLRYPPRCRRPRLRGSGPPPRRALHHATTGGERGTPKNWSRART